MIPALCDIGDEQSVEKIFEQFKPDLVFHAAAYKHVPMQELHVKECFKNNIIGTKIVAEAAHRHKVRKFLLVSTDKAVNPTSVMGATKRICELYCQVLGKNSETTFLSVRFGNVLASDGSVVPIFMDQIKKGGPITVTHPDMRRYFMTIPEAVTLILQATAIGDSGQIMVLEMGEPIHILDLAKHLLTLMGKTSDSIPIEYIGLRPGEKLFEEISFNEEQYIDTVHSKIKILGPGDKKISAIKGVIENAIDKVRKTEDDGEIRLLLRCIVPEYRNKDIRD